MCLLLISNLVLVLGLILIDVLLLVVYGLLHVLLLGQPKVNLNLRVHVLSLFDGVVRQSGVNYVQQHFLDDSSAIETQFSDLLQHLHQLEMSELELTSVQVTDKGAPHVDPSLVGVDLLQQF